MLEDGIERAHFCSEIFQELAAVTEPIEDAAELLNASRVERVGEGTAQVPIGAHTDGGYSVAEEVDVSNTDASISGGELQVVPV